MDEQLYQIIFVFILFLISYGFFYLLLGLSPWKIGKIHGVPKHTK